MTSMMENLNQKTVLLFLRTSCFLLFIGRAWQHLIWDAPFRAFFWDQNLLEGIVSSLTGLSWFDYVTHPNTDSFINYLTIGFGIFYLMMALVTIFINHQSKRLSGFYLVSSALLAILAILYCKEKFYHTAQFFEYSIQFLTPLFLYLFLFKDVSQSRLILFLKIAIALTFVSHGMYAFGYYPQPGVFVDMTINILGISEPAAKQFLKIAGILDFVIGIGIFLPRYSNGILLYAVVWGLSTAIARTWANVQFGTFTFPLLNQYLPQTLYRLPHGLIPLTLYLITSKTLSKIHKKKMLSA